MMRPLTRQTIRAVGEQSTVGFVLLEALLASVILLSSLICFLHYHAHGIRASVLIMQQAEILMQVRAFIEDLRQNRDVLYKEDVIHSCKNLSMDIRIKNCHFRVDDKQFYTWRIISFSWPASTGVYNKTIVVGSDADKGAR